MAAFSNAALVLFTKSAARKIRSLDSKERLAFRKKVVRSCSGRGGDVKAPPGLGLIDKAKDGEAMVVCSEVIDIAEMMGHLDGVERELCSL